MEQDNKIYQYDHCIFCQIAANQLDATIIHRDEKTVVFQDIAPKESVHFLIIPTAHFSSLEEMDETAISIYVPAMMQSAKLVAAKLGIADFGYQIRCNTLEGGGQEVMHLHFHLRSSPPGAQHQRA